ncbi:MAG: GPW/gp25 family protein [Clostridia bacterium]
MSYEKNFLGKGFGFPMKVDKNTGKIIEVSGDEDIKQAIYIIIMTAKGERVMRPDFGCDIHNYVFETIDFTTLSQMESSVKRALVLYEPRITNIEIKAEQDKNQTGKVLLNISYVVRTTNNPYNLVYPFFINEGIEI